MNKELQKDDTIVLKNPRITSSDRSPIEEYRVDKITSESVDLIHADKTEVIEGEEVRVQKNIEREVLEKAIEEGRAALLKDPLEVLYYY